MLARFATPGIAGSGNQRRQGTYRVADTSWRAVAAAAGQAFLLSFGLGLSLLSGNNSGKLNESWQRLDGAGRGSLDRIVGQKSVCSEDVTPRPGLRHETRPPELTLET